MTRIWLDTVQLRISQGSGTESNESRRSSVAHCTRDGWAKNFLMDFVELNIVCGRLVRWNQAQETREGPSVHVRCRGANASKTFHTKARGALYLPRGTLAKDIKAQWTSAQPQNTHRGPSIPPFTDGTKKKFEMGIKTRFVS